MNEIKPFQILVSTEGVNSLKPTQSAYETKTRNRVFQTLTQESLDQNEILRLIAFLEKSYKARKTKLTDDAKFEYFKMYEGSYLVHESIYSNDLITCWSIFLTSLLKNPSALRGIYNMFITGGKPALVGRTKDGGFLVIETNEEPQDHRLGCVYDPSAEAKLIEIEASFGCRQSTGNAVTMAEAMGVKVMTKAVAERYLTALPSDERFACFDLLSHEDPEGKLRTDKTYMLSRCGGDFEITIAQRAGDGINDNIGWRAMVEVPL